MVFLQPCLVCWEFAVGLYSAEANYRLVFHNNMSSFSNNIAEKLESQKESNILLPLYVTSIWLYLYG